MRAAASIRRRVERAPPGAFVRASDFAEHPRTAVDSALSRLARERPDLVRLRKGLYWKGVASRFGAGRPDAIEAALAVAGRGAGPSGVSAANALGLTTQVAANPILAVVGRCPTGVHGARLVSRSNIERRTLRPIEIALLEVLRDFPLHVDGSWGDVVRRAGREVENGRIRLAAVLRVAMVEHSPALRTRAAALRVALLQVPVEPTRP